MADASETTDMSFYSLWSRFDVKGYTEKTSVTRSESPKTTYIEYICHWDCLLILNIHFLKVSNPLTLTHLNTQMS